VAALRANSAGAPRELFDAYGEQVIAYCWPLLRSDDATLIAVRDTMIVAQAHAGRLRDPRLLGPWLLALARAECERRAPTAKAVTAVTTATAGEPGDAATVGEVREAGAAGEAWDADERPPAPAWMRDEILACCTDPRQATYRAFAAARALPLDLEGFPPGSGAMTVRRARRRARGPRLRSGAMTVRAPWWRARGPRLRYILLTAGAGAITVVAMLAVGVWLPGGRPATGACSRPSGTPHCCAGCSPLQAPQGT
jgi:DNA-directed RNA polymerase specialized sigma24 family protein